MSGIGRVANKIRRAHEVAEVAIAEVRSAQGEVQGKVALLTACADASAAHAVEVLSGRVQEVVEHSEKQTLCVAGAVTQQLEREIKPAATVEVQTCTAIEGMCRDVQAQIEQNLVDAQRRDDDTQK